MNIPLAHPYLVTPTQPRQPSAWSLAASPTAPADDAPSKADCKKQLKQSVANIAKLQRTLYADDRFSLLLVFQAMDAAGKDSTIRNVLSGVNPTGCQVFSFKKPSSEELDHDFLWRSACRLPERGRIGVFNRSYYEEVLVVRVHPNYLQYQKLPDAKPNETFWQQRFESINDHEKHLARNGTHIIKFFLNVSQAEQQQRFLSRIDRPEKNWKFEAGDLKESSHWQDYMQAYDDCLKHTSTNHAPWYAVPADNKHVCRMQVASIIEQHLAALPLRYPNLDQDELDQLPELKQTINQTLSRISS